MTPQQALLYRLCGDRNPLHADPDFAKAAGFPAPILHGLCSYGIVLRTLTDELLGGDATRVGGFPARFAGVVFPGETIRVRGWREDGRIVGVRDHRRRGRARRRARARRLRAHPGLTGPNPAQTVTLPHGQASEKLPHDVYEAELYRLQSELVKVQEWVKAEGQRIVIVFEGRDAAGKGGTIKRITQYLNPRVARIVALPSPTDRRARAVVLPAVRRAPPHPR